MIKPQSRCAERRCQSTRQSFVCRCNRHSGRQTTRHIIGKTRTRQNGCRLARQDLAHNIGEQKIGAALNALGANDERRIGTDDALQLLCHAAQSLRGDNAEHNIGICNG
jgi:hypothetical protein